MSARETAIAALAALLQQTGAQVWRGTDLGRDVPPEGLIEVGDGESRPPRGLLSPLNWEIEQDCDVVVTVVRADEIERDRAYDALLARIGALIAADRKLGGAVDWTEPGEPVAEPVELDGAAKSARIPVCLTFLAPETSLG